MKHIFCFIGFLLLLNCTFAQVAIISNSIGLRDQFLVDNLYQISVVNAGTSSVLAKLKGVVLDDRQQKIAEVWSGTMQIAAGSSIIGSQIPWQGLPQFSNNRDAQYLQETGQLTPGNYTICYQLIGNQNVVLSTNCLEQKVRPSSPPELLYPYDQEKITVQYPVLTWRGPLPMPATIGINYDLKLVELRAGQSIQRALISNIPLVYRQGLNISSLTYPMDAPVLEAGKDYAWQVIAYNNRNELGKTSIWKFTYEPKAEPPSENKPKVHSYRFADAEPNGKFYQTKDGVVHFAYDNRMGLANLEYELSCFGEEGMKKIQAPKIDLNSGVNLIDLNLTKLVTSTNKLVLTIIEPNGNRQYLGIDYSSN
jgi:hypothetical protein